MAKFQKIDDKYCWECPACGCMHYIKIPTVGTPVWKFNGDLENPTVSPSIKISLLDSVCHFHIRNGKAEFCSDSTHQLAGQTVEIPEWK